MGNSHDNYLLIEQLRPKLLFLNTQSSSYHYTYIIESQTGQPFENPKLDHNFLSWHLKTNQNNFRLHVYQNLAHKIWLVTNDRKQEETDMWRWRQGKDVKIESHHVTRKGKPIKVSTKGLYYVTGNSDITTLVFIRVSYVREHEGESDVDSTLAQSSVRPAKWANHWTLQTAPISVTQLSGSSWHYHAAVRQSVTLSRSCPAIRDIILR